MIGPKEFCEYLVSQSEGSLGTIGQDIFYSQSVDNPDNTITVNPAPGYPANPQVPISNLSFTIIVRDAVFDNGLDRVRQIASLFRDENHIERCNFSIADTFVYFLRFEQEPEGSFIGYDSSGRPEFSMNLAFHVIRG